MLEAPIYSNRCIEDAWTFLLEIARRHPNRQKHIQECARQLGQSYNWCLVLRGSKQARAVLQELPKALQCAILESANCLDLLECSWSSPPPVKAGVQTSAIETPFPAPSWHWQSEEATERAAQAQHHADGFPSGTDGFPSGTPFPGVPGQNSERLGASAPDTWAQWEAKVARLPKEVPTSGPGGCNPVLPAPEPAVGMMASTAAFNGKRGFGSSNPFVAAVPQLSSPPAMFSPRPHDTTNPFKARVGASQGKFWQRSHTFSAPIS